MKRILLDGKQFSYGDSLEDMARFTNIPLARFAFHPDDIASERILNQAQEDRRALRDLLANTDMSTLTTIAALREFIRLLVITLDIRKP